METDLAPAGMMSGIPEEDKLRTEGTEPAAAMQVADCKIAASHTSDLWWIELTASAQAGLLSWAIAE